MQHTIKRGISEDSPSCQLRDTPYGPNTVLNPSSSGSFTPSLKSHRDIIVSYESGRGAQDRISDGNIPKSCKITPCSRSILGNDKKRSLSNHPRQYRYVDSISRYKAIRRPTTSSVASHTSLSSPMGIQSCTSSSWALEPDTGRSTNDGSTVDRGCSSSIHMSSQLPNQEKHEDIKDGLTRNGSEICIPIRPTSAKTTGRGSRAIPSLHLQYIGVDPNSLQVSDDISGIPQPPSRGTLASSPVTPRSRPSSAIQRSLGGSGSRCEWGGVRTPSWIMSRPITDEDMCFSDGTVSNRKNTTDTTSQDEISVIVRAAAQMHGRNAQRDINSAGSDANSRTMSPTCRSRPLSSLSFPIVLRRSNSGAYSIGRGRPSTPNPECDADLSRRANPTILSNMTKKALEEEHRGTMDMFFELKFPVSQKDKEYMFMFIQQSFDRTVKHVNSLAVACEEAMAILRAAGGCSSSSESCDKEANNDANSNGNTLEHQQKSNEVPPLQSPNSLEASVALMLLFKMSYLMENGLGESMRKLLFVLLGSIVDSSFLVGSEGLCSDSSKEFTSSSKVDNNSDEFVMKNGTEYPLEEEYSLKLDEFSSATQPQVSTTQEQIQENQCTDAVPVIIQSHMDRKNLPSIVRNIIPYYEYFRSVVAPSATSDYSFLVKSSFYVEEFLTGQQRARFAEKQLERIKYALKGTCNIVMNMCRKHNNSLIRVVFTAWRFGVRCREVVDDSWLNLREKFMNKELKRHYLLRWWGISRKEREARLSSDATVSADILKAIVADQKKTICAQEKELSRIRKMCDILSLKVNHLENLIVEENEVTTKAWCKVRTLDDELHKYRTVAKEALDQLYRVSNTIGSQMGNVAVIEAVAEASVRNGTDQCKWLPACLSVANSYNALEPSRREYDECDEVCQGNRIGCSKESSYNKNSAKDALGTRDPLSTTIDTVFKHQVGKTTNMGRVIRMIRKKWTVEKRANAHCNIRIDVNNGEQAAIRPSSAMISTSHSPPRVFSSFPGGLHIHQPLFARLGPVPMANVDAPFNKDNVPISKIPILKDQNTFINKSALMASRAIGIFMVPYSVDPLKGSASHSCYIENTVSFVLFWANEALKEARSHLIYLEGKVFSPSIHVNKSRRSGNSAPSVPVTGAYGNANEKRSSDRNHVSESRDVKGSPSGSSYGDEDTHPIRGVGPSVALGCLSPTLTGDKDNFYISDESLASESEISDMDFSDEHLHDVGRSNKDTSGSGSDSSVLFGSEDIDMYVNSDEWDSEEDGGNVPRNNKDVREDAAMVQACGTLSAPDTSLLSPVSLLECVDSHPPKPVKSSVANTCNPLPDSGGNSVSSPAHLYNESKQQQRQISPRKADITRNATTAFKLWKNEVLHLCPRMVTSISDFEKGHVFQVLLWRLLGHTLGISDFYIPRLEGSRSKKKRTKRGRTEFIKNVTPNNPSPNTQVQTLSITNGGQSQEKYEPPISSQAVTFNLPGDVKGNQEESHGVVRGLAYHGTDGFEEVKNRNRRRKLFKGKTHQSSGMHHPSLYETDEERCKRVVKMAKYLGVDGGIVMEEIMSCVSVREEEWPGIPSEEMPHDTMPTNSQVLSDNTSSPSGRVSTGFVAAATRNEKQLFLLLTRIMHKFVHSVPIHATTQEFRENVSSGHSNFSSSVSNGQLISGNHIAASPFASLSNTPLQLLSVFTSGSKVPIMARTNSRTKKSFSNFTNAFDPLYFGVSTVDNPTVDKTSTFVPPGAALGQSNSFAQIALRASEGVHITNRGTHSNPSKSEANTPLVLSSFQRHQLQISTDCATAETLRNAVKAIKEKLDLAEAWGRYSQLVTNFAHKVAVAVEDNKTSSIKSTIFGRDGMESSYAGVGNCESGGQKVNVHDALEPLVNVPPVADVNNMIHDDYTMSSTKLSANTCIMQQMSKNLCDDDDVNVLHQKGLSCYVRSLIPVSPFYVLPALSPRESLPTSVSQNGMLTTMATAISAELVLHLFLRMPILPGAGATLKLCTLPLTKKDRDSNTEGVVGDPKGDTNQKSEVPEEERSKLQEEAAQYFASEVNANYKSNRRVIAGAALFYSCCSTTDVFRAPNVSRKVSPIRRNGISPRFDTSRPNNSIAWGNVAPIAFIDISAWQRLLGDISLPYRDANGIDRSRNSSNTCGVEVRDIFIRVLRERTTAVFKWLSVSFGDGQTFFSSNALPIAFLYLFLCYFQSVRQCRRAAKATANPSRKMDVVSFGSLPFRDMVEAAELFKSFMNIQVIPFLRQPQSHLLFQVSRRPDVQVVFAKNKENIRKVFIEYCGGSRMVSSARMSMEQFTIPFCDQLNFLEMGSARFLYNSVRIGSALAVRQSESITSGGSITKSLCLQPASLNAGGIDYSTFLVALVALGLRGKGTHGGASVGAADPLSSYSESIERFLHKAWFPVYGMKLNLMKW